MLPLNLYARVRVFVHVLHTRPRVQRAPGFPCALYRGRRLCNPRASHAARMRARVPRSLAVESEGTAITLRSAGNLDINPPGTIKWEWGAPGFFKDLGFGNCAAATLA
jgi:hypothetical protein